MGLSGDPYIESAVPPPSIPECVTYFEIKIIESRTYLRRYISAVPTSTNVGPPLNQHLSLESRDRFLVHQTESGWGTWVARRLNRIRYGHGANRYHREQWERPADEQTSPLSWPDLVAINTWRVNIDFFRGVN